MFNIAVGDIRTVPHVLESSESLSPSSSVISDSDPVLHVHSSAAPVVLVAGGQRTFMCPELGCGVMFNTRFSLKRHQKKHTGERPFQCERPYKCCVRGCRKSFADRTNVRRHLALHEEERAARAHGGVVSASLMSNLFGDADDDDDEIDGDDDSGGESPAIVAAAAAAAASSSSLPRKVRVVTVSATTVRAATSVSQSSVLPCPVERCGRTFHTPHEFEAHLVKCKQASPRFDPMTLLALAASWDSTKSLSSLDMDVDMVDDDDDDSMAN